MAEENSIFKPAEKVVYNDKLRECTFFYEQTQYKMFFESDAENQQAQFKVSSISNYKTYLKTINRDYFSDVFYSNTIKNNDKFTKAIEELIKKRQFSINFANNNSCNLSFRKRVEDIDFIYVTLELIKIDNIEQDIFEIQKELRVQAEKIENLENKVDDKLDLVLRQLKKLRNDVQEIKLEKRQIQDKIQIAVEDIRLSQKERVNDLRHFIKTGTSLNFKKEYQAITMNDDELPLLNSEITHSKNLVFIFQHLRNECNKELNFTRIYSAKINGDSSVTFHKHCDNKGPTLTIVQDSEGNVFGGFTNLSWKSANSAEWIGNDPSSFLFSVNKQKIILHDNDVREKTITVCRSNGPIFGDDDLVISDGCTRNYESWNFMKNSFGKKDNSISKSYLTSGKIEFLVSNYEVFSVE